MNLECNEVQVMWRIRLRARIKMMEKISVKDEEDEDGYKERADDGD